MSGRIVHFEIPYDDGDRARAFYADAFGWSIQPMPEMDYTIASTGPVTDEGMASEPGYINGGMFQRTEQIGRPMLTIDVDDVDAALTRIESLGGKTVEGRRAVGDMGFTGYFTDSEGNLLGIWQSAAPS